ncbi:hypothetical protein [Flavobacterium aestivum]|uniref:hypothetical protein n=1 Tax=Flavobacterium aestivum TaxID=3003257 RepID=UPI002285C4F1|nr:hypothetical protein [Flavobacterium aestivum]
MKVLFTSIFIVLSSLPKNNTDSVYICISKTASKYHLTTNCRGLNQCTHEVRKVSLKEANELGYKELCGWEK